MVKVITIFYFPGYAYLATIFWDKCALFPPGNGVLPALCAKGSRSRFSLAVFLIKI
jgi:hypothetical protein